MCGMSQYIKTINLACFTGKFGSCSWLRAGKTEMETLNSWYDLFHFPRLLLALGADRTLRNDFNLTPEDQARRNGHFEIAQLLA